MFRISQMNEVRGGFTIQFNEYEMEKLDLNSVDDFNKLITIYSGLLYS